jgi:hypothetical protein
VTAAWFVVAAWLAALVFLVARDFAARTRREDFAKHARTRDTLACEVRR